MIFRRASRPLLGLDITTSSVKLIELARSGDGFRVESYAAEASPPNAISEKAIVDAEAVGEAVRRAVKRSGAKTRDAAIPISGDAAITKVIQMPASFTEAELEGQVEMQADQYIPFPMEEVYLVAGPWHEYADQAGIDLAIEPLNRFECYFLTTAGEAARFARAVDHPRLGVMYDTFHSHIEEKSTPGAIRETHSRRARPRSAWLTAARWWRR